MPKPKAAKLSFLAPRLTAIDTRTAQPAPKVADPHYATPEHQAWRAAVIRRAGGMCQAPGCGRTGVRLFADHVRELRDGGDPLDPANGQALCGAHHTAKTASERARRQGERYHRPRPA
ncbi:HNH endonuclease signature motif containing protein [Roseomonas sp. BN140053]|uniref:HNH endonuclease signature motif containing protein n=1 Tax=Roseomonas sp. BN140053 TaxID=3391898 RepID=UPI0039EB8AED